VSGMAGLFGGGLGEGGGNVVGTALVLIRPEMSRFAQDVSSGIGGMSSSFDKLASVGKTAFLGIGAAALGVGAVSLKLAGDFEATMERLHTQAQVPQAAIKGLSQSVLDMAASVGTAPDSLAESLYHVESAFQSTGITGQRAMDIVRIAAEGAKIGGANLVDVTNALDGAIVSGIPGAENFEHAMGMLNATVGSGDMKMQDLAEAIGTGVLPVVKNYGLSLTDASAALATFGDNNIRGAVAGTSLRMAVQALAVPTKKGEGLLKDLGLTAHSLAEDMQSGGLIKAFDDLKGHMTDAGYTGVQTGEKLTELFGKRAGTGVAILFDQLDRLKSKYGDIAGAAGNFGDAWKETTKTFNFQLDQLKTSAEVLGIKLGVVLIPKVRQLATALMDGFQWLQKHHDIAILLAAAIGGPLVAAMGAFLATELAAAAPIIAIGLAIAGLAVAVTYAYTHFAAFRQAVAAVGQAVIGVAAKVKQGFNIIKTVFEGGEVVPTSGFVGAMIKIGQAVRVVVDDVTQGFAKVKQGFAIIKTVFEGGEVVKTSGFVGAMIKIGHAARTLVDFFTTEVVPRVVEFAQAVAAQFSHLVAAVSSRMDAIKEAVGHIFAVLKFIVEAALDVIIVMWRLFGDQIINIITIVWNEVKLVVSTAIRIVRDVIDLVLALINGDWGKAWDALKDIVGAVLGLIVTTVGNLLGVIVQIIEGALHGLEAIWSTIWHSLINAVTEAIGDVISTVSGLPGRILSALGNLGRLLFNAGRDIVIGLLNGIESLAGSVASKVASLIPGAGIAKDVLGHIPGFASGGIIKARPGGTIINVGEGGEDEIVIPVSKYRVPVGSGSSAAAPSTTTPAPGNTYNNTYNNTYTVNVPNYVGSKRELVAWIVPELRRLALEQR